MAPGTATNVVDADVAVITNVSFDHAEVLGPDLEGIARDKAGIIKPGSRHGGRRGRSRAGDVISVGAAEAVGAVGIWVRGEEFGCTANRVAVGGRLLDSADPGWRPTVRCSCRCTGHTRATTRRARWRRRRRSSAHRSTRRWCEDGFAAVTVPGRLEVVGRQPLCMVDGAHNVAGDGGARPRRSSRSSPSTVRRWRWSGMLAGRDPSAMLHALALGRDPYGGRLRPAVAAGHARRGHGRGGRGIGHRRGGGRHGGRRAGAGARRRRRPTACSS